MGLLSLMIGLCLSQLSIKTRIETREKVAETEGISRLSQLSIKTRIETYDKACNQVTS